ncbi:MAG: hypothetical protein K8W52_13925 [Deltaproteobacteria bacterium]|nr:hypothetical protein [Deltaproteobacteria bacterium]
MRPTSLIVACGFGTMITSGGCPLLEVQVETKEVCLQYQGVEVPASDGSGGAHVEFVFEDFASLQGLAQLDGDVKFVRADLHATSGVTDFGFLTSARGTVGSDDPAAGLPTQTVVDCSGEGCVRDGATLSVDAVADVDALAYLRSNSIAITLDVQGTLPTTPWTMDVSVCVSGTVKYTQQL